MGAVLAGGRTKGNVTALPTRIIHDPSDLGGAEGQASDVENPRQYMLN